MIPKDILQKVSNSHKNSRRRYHDIMLYARGRRDGFISGCWVMISFIILFGLMYFVFIYSNK